MDGSSGDDAARLRRRGPQRKAARVPGGNPWIAAVVVALLVGAGITAALLWRGETPAQRIAVAPVPDAPAPEPRPAAVAVPEPPEPRPAVVAVPETFVAPPTPLVAPPPTPVVAPLPALAPPILASEAEIRGMTPNQPTMVRLRENPRVFVLLFPTLEDQAAALNRLAALIEKSGLPRDRVLSEAELAEVLQQRREQAATWYLGHDYEGVDIARFLTLAARDGLPLNPAETWMAERFRQARALVPEGAEVALISTANADHRFDAASRAAILRHEIGHGHFFTLPEVRAHVQRVWRERFRDKDRQAMRAFLGREGYDTTNELLMANESMAYLLFTPDQRFFAPRMAGLTPPEVQKLRDLMREGFPLRDVALGR